MLDTDIKMALTFDDLLLVPAESTILPKDVDTRTNLTNSIVMNIPIISAAVTAIPTDTPPLLHTIVILPQNDSSVLPSTIHPRAETSAPNRGLRSAIGREYSAPAP